MSRVVIDTGPLVALLNAHDAHHHWTCDMLDRMDPPLVTCEAVISEACVLTRRLQGGPAAVLELLARGVIEIGFRLNLELDAVTRLMQRYASVPMSLADACLVRMSELDEQAVILTLDGDFRIYRRNKRQSIPTIVPG